MTIRTLHADLEASLLAYDPFIVVHLVKFEKPQSVIQYGGKLKGVATDYTYITDSQYDIIYNDGAADIEGTPHNTGVGSGETYRANKLTKLGTINESILAKASNLTMTLDSSSLGAAATVSATFTASEMATDIDLTEAGFQEGDKILLSGDTTVAGSFVTGTVYTIITSGTTDFIAIGAANNTPGTFFAATGAGSGTGSAGPSNIGAYIRIEGFKNEGKTVVYTAINPITANSFVTQAYTLTLSSEELNILLADKNGTSYTNYINREVLIYKAHINPSSRAIIGEPFLYFKGITSGASITEKVDSSEIQWTLSSHWGDFLRVQGRLTDDATHRALRADGSPDLESVIKPSYASDLGFLHSNSAINAIADYNTKEIRYKNVSSGFLGLSSKTKEYWVDVPRTTDLQFNTQAKMLPVVYGVHKIDSFPIFVDTHKTTSAEVYRVDALCEGPIAGVLDIHIEDNTTICIDAQDSAARGTPGDSVPVVCYGRQDRGDTLTHYNANVPDTATSFTYNGVVYNIPGGLNLNARKYFNTSYSSSPVGTGTNFEDANPAATGILHEGSHTITKPISASFTFHSGSPDQAADNTLVSLASAGNFKIQNDYYTGNETYWGPSHQVLDTAYVVGKYTIADGETTLPEMQFIVRGRDPECYNYDGSYKMDSSYTATNINSVSDFNLNDTVTLWTSTTTPVAIDSSTTYTIIDKWSSYDINGDSDHRYRLSTIPALGDNTAFYMQNSSGQKWYMQTWDHAEESSAVPRDLLYTSDLTHPANGTNTGKQFQLDTPSTQLSYALGHSTAILGMYNPNDLSTLASNYSDFEWGYSILNDIASLSYTTGITRVYAKNAIALATSASSTANYYNGNTITLIDIVGGAVYTQIRTIVDYDGSTKVAMVDEPWDYTNLPSSNSKYSIGSVGDRRVTINPSMQLLDYMTNIRYGKGLDIVEDINLDTWISAARECDTRSDVTVIVPTGLNIVKNQLWSYPDDSAPYQWRGTVDLVEPLGGYQQVTFTNCIGKLGAKWNSWKVFASGDLYWNDGKAYTGGGSTIPTAPTSGHLTTVLIGNGSITAEILTGGVSANGNPLVKKYSPSSLNFVASGYSLYDSDDVKYWRYIGWDDSAQRNVTRHQMNQVISTKAPLFDNINKMLQQFNGILRYSVGKYELDIKSKKPVLVDAEKISADDIVGTIKLTDKGLKNSKNYVSASILDPHNKFEGRSVSFFNSTYLKEDKGIQKKGQFSMPGITNYYNARFNIKQYLDESRYGLQVQFTMAPRGLLLLAGNIIEFTYPRFGYVSKAFRITNLNFKKDGLVDVTADEHNDDAYIVEAGGDGSGVVETTDTGPGNHSDVPAAPSALETTDANIGEIILKWTNSSKHNISTHVTEIHRGSTANFQPDDDPANTSTYSLIGTSLNNTYHDPVSEETAGSSVTRYYRIRYKVKTASHINGAPTQIVSSLYHPLLNVNGISGSSIANDAAKVVNLTASQYVVPYTAAGAESTTITLTATSKNISGERVYKFYVDGTLKQTTNPTSNNTETFVLPDVDEPASGAQVTVRVDVEQPSGTVVAFDPTSIYGIKDGTDGYTVILTNEAHTIPADAGGVAKTYANSGTDIRVFRGSTAVPYGTGNGKFVVTAVGTDITPQADASATIVSTYTRRYSNAIGMDNADFAAIITFTITVTDSDGVALVFTKIQSFTKGKDGQGVKTVELFRRNSYADAPTSQGTYANPQAGVNTSWTIAQPDITDNNQTIYKIYRTFTSDGLAPHETNWNGPVIVAKREDGLRSIQGYLYYESTGSTAPAAPANSLIYTFSTGLVTGTGTGTTAGTWTNAPRTQDASSTNTHWAIRYWGTEASTAATSITIPENQVTSAVKSTSFSGVVTFNSGTGPGGSGRFETGGTPITTIDGGNINTGTINVNRLSVGAINGTASRMLILEDSLKIFSGTTLRVHIGNLANNDT